MPGAGRCDIVPLRHLLASILAGAKGSALPRFGFLSAVLLLGIGGGWVLGAVAPGLAQNASPVAESTEHAPAHLGGDLPGDPHIQLVKVASGLDDPVNIAFPPDGSGRIVVVERQGLIRVVDADGTVRKEPYLDLSQQVTLRGSPEEGLLGLAFHPDFATNGRFFVDYNARTANSDVFVSEYHVAADDPNRANPDSERVLLRIAKPFDTHNGGTLRFDPEGKLFIAVGDGGEYGDPFDNAQNRFSLLGKMLRIDVDGGGPRQPYGIPPDNPFAGRDRYDNPFPGTLQDAEGRARRGEERRVGQMVPQSRKFQSPVAPEIWALGLRNPWSFAIDPETGDVFIGDVGAQNWEEIDFWPAGTVAGQNYGWDWLEGSHCFPAELSECPRQQVGVLPVAEYAHGVDGCAVIALGVYRDPDAPDLDGVLLSGDYCTGQIRGMKRDDAGQWVFQDLLNTDLLITSGNQDAGGAIYVTGRVQADAATAQAGDKSERGKKQRGTEELQGTVWRIVPADQVPPGGVNQ
jgi:glucose/arabinose dehydrogenase